MSNLFLHLGFNAGADALSNEPLPRERFREPCAICRQADGTHDVHPFLRDGFACKECFDSHVEPARLRIIARSKRWAAAV